MQGDYGGFGLNAWVANDRGGMHENKNWRSLHVKGGFEIPVFVDCQWVDGLPEVFDEPPVFEVNVWHGTAMPCAASASIGTTGR
jgi:hypothetical protein